VYGLFDPSGKTLWLSVDHRRLRPVDDMVLLGCLKATWLSVDQRRLRPVGDMVLLGCLKATYRRV